MTILNGYATLAEYKTWIAVRGLSGSVGTDTSDDAALELLIEGVSRYIDRQTARRFYAESVDSTRYYTAKNTTLVYIDDLSAAPTSISVDGSNSRTYTALAATEYDLTPDNALTKGEPYDAIRLTLQTTQYFPAWRRGVKVIGKFGFPAVPADVKEACLAIVQSVNGSRSGQTSGGKVTVTASGVVIRPEDVPALALATMMSYRKRT